MAESKGAKRLKKRRRLLQLWEQQRHLCYYCQKPTILIFRGSGHAESEPLRDDEATIEHVYSRLRPQRAAMQAANQSIPKVMACRGCNALKAQAERNGQNNR